MKTIQIARAPHKGAQYEHSFWKMNTIRADQKIEDFSPLFDPLDLKYDTLNEDFECLYQDLKVIFKLLHFKEEPGSALYPKILEEGGYLVPEVYLGEQKYRLEAGDVFIVHKHNALSIIKAQDFEAIKEFFAR